MKRILLALCAATACAPASLKPVAQTATVDRSFTSIGFQVSNRPTNNLAAKAINVDGQVAICAAIFEAKGGITVAEATDYLKRGATFHIGDDRIAAGAGFAPVYAGLDLMAGKQARCASTGAAWKPAYARQKVRITIKSGFVGS